METTKLKLMHQKKSNIILNIIFTICLVPSISIADVTGNLISNGTFESGNSHGWNTTGEVTVLNDCCGSQYDLEIGLSGSINQSFDLTSNTITQTMLDNGITLNSSVQVQNGECGLAQCWGGSGPADTFTIQLQIKDSDNNVLATTTQERTNVTGINGKNFTDSVSYTQSGSNRGAITISGSDSNGVVGGLGGPNFDNVEVTMTYEPVVLTALETENITTAFEEVEEVLNTVEPEQLFIYEEFIVEEFIPIEKPEVLTEILELVTYEKTAIEEINTGVIQISSLALEEKIIPTEVLYEEPKTIEAFTTEIESFETETERTEISNIVGSFEREPIESTNNARESAGTNSEIKLVSAEKRNGRNKAEPIERKEINRERNGNSSTENKTRSVEESEQESSRGVSEETEQSNNQTSGNESVDSNENSQDDNESEIVSETNEVNSTRSNNDVSEQTENNISTTYQTFSIDEIQKKVNQTVKSVDQQLIITSLIISRAMQNNDMLDTYIKLNENIFNNQLEIDGGEYIETREYVDDRNIYFENQNIYNDNVAKFEKNLQDKIDNRIRAEEHLRRIRGY